MNSSFPAGTSSARPKLDLARRREGFEVAASLVNCAMCQRRLQLPDGNQGRPDVTVLSVLMGQAKPILGRGHNVQRFRKILNKFRAWLPSNLSCVRGQWPHDDFQRFGE